MDLDSTATTFDSDALALRFFILEFFIDLGHACESRVRYTAHLDGSHQLKHWNSQSGIALRHGVFDHIIKKDKFNERELLKRHFRQAENPTQGSTWRYSSSSTNPLLFVSSSRRISWSRGPGTSSPWRCTKSIWIRKNLIYNRKCTVINEIKTENRT